MEFSQDHSRSGKAASATLAAVRLLLRPIVTLLIRSGVSWKGFADVAKTSFVEVATSDFGIRGRPTNAARVAILTGIHRREVTRQREWLAQSAVPEPTYHNTAQRVLSGWHQDADYLDAEGQPRELPVTGPVPSFADLCDRYAGDMPATALLKELRKVGNVVAVPSGLMRAASRVYIPHQLDPEKVLRAGAVLSDIGRTIVHDLTCAPGDPLRFERRAENDRIEPKHLGAFRAMLEREGQALLERVDDWLTQHEAVDISPETPLLRLGVGMYHIQNPAHPVTQS
jgi:Family of unknown function (DUF6502)